MGPARPMGSGPASVEELLHDFERAYLGQVGLMQAVVVDDVLEHGTPLVARETEEAHVVRVHAHEPGKRRSLVGQQEMGVRRSPGDENAVEQVEKSPFGILFGVGQEAQKARKAEQEPKVEIGLPLFHQVEEAYRLGEEVEKRGIGLGLPKQAGEHLGEEQSHGRLHRVAVDVVPHLDGTHVAQTEYILAGTRLGVDFEIREWGEKRAQCPRPPALRLGQEISGAPELRGIDLHDRHLVVVGDRVQHDTPGFYLHIGVKKCR